MIKGLNQTGKYMNVTGSHAATYLNIPPYTYQNNPLVGSVRYSSSNDIEVYDGMTWRTITGSLANVGLSTEAENILDWARRKMMEEADLDRLARDNPAINDLVNQINEKKNQIEMVKALIKKDKNVDEEPQAYQAP